MKTNKNNTNEPEDGEVFEVATSSDKILGVPDEPRPYGLMLRPASRRRPGGPIVWHTCTRPSLQNAVHPCRR
jgi:hypothetical protein